MAIDPRALEKELSRVLQGQSESEMLFKVVAALNEKFSIALKVPDEDEVVIQSREGPIEEKKVPPPELPTGGAKGDDQPYIDQDANPKMAERS